MLNNQGQRYLILLAAVVCMLCIGAGYAWSVFQKPLIQMFAWTPSETSLAFTLYFVTTPIAMIVAGRYQEKIGPRLIIMIGGLSFASGNILTGFASSLPHLYISYGLLGGIGNGVVYGCAITNTVKWFPDKKGLAAGLIAGGYGLGAMVFAPIAATLIQTYDVLSAFKILGIGYLVLLIVAANFVKEPPPGFKPEGWQPISNPMIPTGVTDKKWNEMLREPIFYVVWVMYTIGAMAGLMIIGHAAPIGQEVIRLSIPMAAMAVSILALANTGGRVIWGAVSDRTGPYKALIMIFIIYAVMMFFLTAVSSFLLFVITLSAIGLCFGGLFAIFPSISANLFGMKNLSLNYGILFTAFGAGAFIGPRLAAIMKETSGEYTVAFIVASVLSACGIALTFFANKKSKAPPKVAL
jgi:OFA family oxalate/formate antiporter-like MFS transporter